MALSEAQEWLELEKRMKDYIEQNADEKWIGPPLGEHSPLYAGNYGIMKGTIDDHLDLDSVRHRFGYGRMTPTNCELGHLEAKSGVEAVNRFFDIIEDDVLSLYDPCAQLRIWNAYQLQDKQFFAQLGRAISKAVKGKQPTKGYLYILRNFLVVLQDNEIVDLKSGDATEWNKAFSIIEKLRRKKPALTMIKTKPKYLRGPKLFRENCQKWFRST